MSYTFQILNILCRYCNIYELQYLRIYSTLYNVSCTNKLDSAYIGAIKLVENTTSK